MPPRARSFNALSFLPDALHEALHRRLREIIGIGLILAAAFIALALATWSVQDPSLSHATNNPLRNMLGLPGAIIADLLIQLFGMAALAIVLPIAIWGWRIASPRPLARERLRICAWLIGVLLAAAGAAFLPRTATWPLPAGLGGVIGDWMLRLPMWFAGGALSGPASMAAALAIGSLALACLAVVAGFGWSQAQTPRIAKPRPHEVDEDEEPRAWISLGWITHAALSLKARIRRPIAGHPRARAVPARDALQRRTEPRFEETTNASLQPRLEPQPESDDEQEPTAARARSNARATARPARRSAGGYALPPIELLAVPKAI